MLLYRFRCRALCEQAPERPGEAMREVVTDSAGSEAQAGD